MKGCWYKLHLLLLQITSRGIYVFFLFKPISRFCIYKTINAATEDV